LFTAELAAEIRYVLGMDHVLSGYFLLDPDHWQFVALFSALEGQIGIDLL
jgi:hypothetical protein